VPPLQSAIGERKRRGDYPTPHWLVDAIVEQAVFGISPGRDVIVLDPACGDGRFLVAAARRIRAAGGHPVLVGADIDPRAVDAARRATSDADATIECRDALSAAWEGERFDIVLGNPPYLSQLAAATTRGGASRHGGGPYADAAVEFLALAVRLARPGGRIGVVLPQSVLASRDADSVRAATDEMAAITWSWWSPRPVFDAQVLVCALVLERRSSPAERRPWTEIVTGRLGVPALPALQTDGELGDRARLTANFRDQYYGLVPAVTEDGDGPALVTSGLVDPGRCHWGQRPVTFAKRRFRRPTVELDRLEEWMRRWADGLLVPKVVVANQTRVIEAVADPSAEWIPGIPLITARPTGSVDADAIAAVLTSPVASAWAWQRAGGTGLSATALRLGPRWLAELPWPAGDLAAAVLALEAGDVAACGDAVSAAYGLDPSSRTLHSWWLRWLPGRNTIPLPDS
jgi:SAM-dependent methyltransferase